MKTKLFLFTSALLMAVSLISCKKDKNNSNDNGGKDQVTYTIDGGTFHNQVISFSVDPKSTDSGDNGAVVYDSNYSTIYLDDAPTNGGTAKLGLSIAFNKADTGTAEVNDQINSSTAGDADRVHFLLGLQENGNPMKLEPTLLTPQKTPGKITITKFGPIGGTVEGTFEGKLISLGSPNITYTISKGHFVITRTL